MEREATRWLQPIYTSLISFVFHLPILLVPTTDIEKPARDKSVTVESIVRGKAFAKKHTAASEYNFRQVHHVLFILRILIHIAVYVILYLELRNVVLATRPQHDASRAYIGETFSALSHSVNSKVAGYMMVVSTALWVFGYIHMRWFYARKANTELVPIPWLYFWSHLDPINFILDIPDYRVPTNLLLRYIILGINFTAGAILAFTIIVRRPLILAWGCYPLGTKIADLQYGVCYGYYGSSTKALAPACDQPGVVCGEEDVRWKSLYAQEIHLTLTLVSISALIYVFIGYQHRLEYFELQNAILQFSGKKQIRYTV